MSAPEEFQDLNPVRVIKEELEESDRIIAIMGPPGAGKSTLIQAATGRDFGVSHSLESPMRQVTAIRVKRKNNYVVLVEFPGFGDAYLSDYNALKLICDWLRDSSASPAQSVKLCGTLYLYNISDNYMGGTKIKNLELFQKICGTDYFERVIFTTTMWPDDPLDYHDAKEQEKKLCQEYWHIMLQKGSSTVGFDGTQRSAWSILDPLAKKARQSIRIQKELKKSWKDVPDTAAGKQLHGYNETSIERQNADVGQLLAKMGETTDQELKDTQVKEWLSLREEQERAAQDGQRLDSWVGGRFLKIFIPKGKHAPAAPFPYEDRCRELISDISKNDEQCDRISKLSEVEAETMSAFLALITNDMERKDEHNRSRLRDLYRTLHTPRRRYSHSATESRPQVNFHEVYTILLSIIRNDTIEDPTMKSLPATPVS